ncbi:Conserved_hypothetical protein [Hexamita inflata]|uniref:5'-Nucleotidase C-terminal domain-containing protein n=1 Tax=Hexamita inflata TaxID=28002 RepID=A0AA86QY01_9EUKA|nr:Conserved hypothetical protein [Hexamita inflata]
MLLIQTILGSVNHTFQINQTMYMDQNQLSLIAKPFIATILIRTGSDLVIFPSSFFNGSLQKGVVTKDDLLQLIDSPRVRLVSQTILGSDLKALMQHIIYRSYCEAALSFPQMYGMYVDFNRSTCLMQFVEYCTWYVSQSYVCKRWSPIKSDELYAVMFEQDFYNQIPKQFFTQKGQESEVNASLVVEHFMNKYSYEGIKQDTTLHYRKQEKHTNNFFITLIAMICFGLGSKHYIKNKQLNPQSETQSMISKDNSRESSQRDDKD